MRNEIPFTDEEIEVHFDEDGPICGTIEDITFTRETLSDWIESRKRWNECGFMDEATLGGFNALIFEGAQVHKGERRKTIVLIDYGTVRAVMAA